jgi:hypothetical protein
LPVGHARKEDGFRAEQGHVKTDMKRLGEAVYKGIVHSAGNRLPRMDRSMIKGNKLWKTNNAL